MFHVGQKVVCIRSQPWRHETKNLCSRERAPATGEVLTVRDVYYRAGEPYSFLMFNEIVNPKLRTDERGNPAEAKFCAIWFKPAVDTSKQVELLKRQCLPAPEREREGV